MNRIQVHAHGYPKVIDGQITMISLDVLDSIWPQIVPFLEKSSEWFEEYYSVDDLLDCARSGDLQLWVAVENSKIFAIGFTGIVEYPKCRILKCVFLAGSGAKRVLKGLEEIHQWAAMLGCTRSEIVGRLPWRRLAAPLGYTERGVVMVKNIANASSDRRH